MSFSQFGKFPVMISILLLCCWMSPLSALDNDDGLARLAESAEKGPDILLEYVIKSKAKAPLIYSKWYVVERIAPKDPKQAEIEMAHREFGRSLLKSLESTSRELQGKLDSKERARKAKVLLDLADWVGEPPGYGNAWLFYRLQSLATVPLGYLIGDLGYPELEIKPLLDRLVGYPNDLKRNIRALNLEASQPIFKIAAKMKTDDVYDPLLAPAWYGKCEEAFNWLHTRYNYAIMQERAKSRSLLPPDLAFFIDDEAAYPFTSLRQWDLKFHEKFVLGLVDRNIRALPSFFLFRQKVGRFPEKPEFTEEQQATIKEEKEEGAKEGIRLITLEERYSGSPRKAAFAQAWEPFRKYGNQFADAFDIYEAVIGEAFFEDETRMAKHEDELNKANAEYQARAKEEQAIKEKEEKEHLKKEEEKRKQDQELRKKAAAEGKLDDSE